MLQRLTIAAFSAGLCLGVVGSTLTVLAAPQQLSFENYAVSTIYNGKPAALVANATEQQDLIPVLEHSIKKGTNFAGHYAIVDGLDYAMGRKQAGIVDLKTGKMYLPAELNGYSNQRGGGYIPPRPDGGLHYKNNSKLLILIGTGGTDGNKGIGKFYYKWENNQLKLLKFVDSPYELK